MKKTNIVLTILTIAIFLLLVACGGGGENTSKDGDNKTDSPIVGKWKVVKAEGMSASSNMGMVYEFMSDGKAKISSGEYEYSFSGDTLKMDYEGAGTIVLTWIYEIEGDNLMLDNASDADQQLWFEKQ